MRVILDSSATPPVIIIPKRRSIPKGAQKIEWTPIANEDFAFTSLTPLDHPNPFSNIVVQSSMITSDYSNTTSGEYGYTIVVTSTRDGEKYSSEVIGGGGGNATIKNN